MFKLIDGLIYFIFPIIQIIVTNIFSNALDCKNAFIRINVWLNIDAILTILTGINIYYYIEQDRRNLCEIITTVFYYVFGFLNILWFILGIIDIFNNCIMYEPNDVKFYLILSLGGVCFLIYKIFVVKKRDRRPLLDIDNL